MPVLAPSLKLVFAELDARWPNRDRRTDGWSRVRTPGADPSDHFPDSAGRVHAIDIDKDGIDANLVADLFRNKVLPTNYVIWNRRIADRDNGFKWVKYTGTSNPHTDHIHLSIERADWARNYKAGWGIARASHGFGSAPSGGEAAPSTGWDFKDHVNATANWLQQLAISAEDFANGIRGMRR